MKVHKLTLLGVAVMYWVHGKIQFSRDSAPRTYTRYGPFTEKAIARYALIHVRDHIFRHGGIELDYSISRKKSS